MKVLVLVSVLKKVLIASLPECPFEMRLMSSIRQTRREMIVVMLQDAPYSTEVGMDNLQFVLDDEAGNAR